MPPVCHIINSSKRFSIASLVTVAVLSGCASSPGFVPVPGVDPEKDSGPTREVDVRHVPDAVPQVEPRTIAGNKSPYTVLGKTYQLLPSSDNYRERGEASWYGRKFHGRKTSNGDTYDMYGMTAAHKTLPIPTYVKVTNLKNGKSVIVRVNDRGPFHGGRIIDLSYAAAQKLDFHKVGTATVEVEAIDPIVYHRQNKAGTMAAAPSAPTAVATTTASVAVKPALAAGGSASNSNTVNALTYLQTGAFSSAELATKMREQIAQLISYPVFISREYAQNLDPMQQLFKVRIGPVKDNLELRSIQELLQLHNLPTPLVVYD